MTEAELQRKCVKWARDNGWYAVKGQSAANRGTPDFIFFKNGEAVFVEFKQPGKKPTKLQEKHHAEIRERCFLVEVISEYWEFVDAMS